LNLLELSAACCPLFAKSASFFAVAVLPEFKFGAQYRIAICFMRYNFWQIHLPFILK